MEHEAQVTSGTRVAGDKRDGGSQVASLAERVPLLPPRSVGLWPGVPLPLPLVPLGPPSKTPMDTR